MDENQVGILSEWIENVRGQEVQLGEKEKKIAASLVKAILSRREEEMYVVLGERWRETGYEGYTVSSMGRVRSYWRSGFRGTRTLQTNPRRVLKATPNSAGYRQAVLYNDGKKYDHSVHGLVARAFLGPCPDGLVVHHCDGNKLNNQVANLQYITDTENKREGWRHKREEERRLSGQTAFSW